MTETIEKYSKIILECTGKEITGIALSLGLTQNEINKIGSKDQLINTINEKYPNEFDDFENKVYYFKITKDGSKPEMLEHQPRLPTLISEYTLKEHRVRKYAYTKDTFEEIFFANNIGSSGSRY